MGCHANTSPKAPTCRGYHPDYLAYVATELNDRPRRFSAGKHRQKVSSNYCQAHPLLRPPLESTHCSSLDEVGARLCPIDLVTSTPQTFRVTFPEWLTQPPESTPVPCVLLSTTLPVRSASPEQSLTDDPR